MSAGNDHDELLRRFPTVESVSRRPGPGRVDHVTRRIGIVLLLLVVVVGCLGYLGPRSATETGRSSAGTVELEHPSMTRPGLDVEFSVTATPTGAADTFTVVVEQAALTRLGIELVTPEPEEQRTTGGLVEMDFAAPAGASEQEVHFSGRTPTTQVPGRHRWTVEWRPADGAPVQLDATTWTVP